jgi:hypothetical protein
VRCITKDRYIEILQKFLEKMQKYRISNSEISISTKVKQSHYRPGQALRVPGG